MKSGNREERRLLLIPFAPGIGDVVMMEPLLRAVCARLPEWRVTMVAKEYAADLLQPGEYRLVSPRYFVTEPPAPLRPLDRLIPRRFVAWAAEPAMALDLGPFDRVINLFWVWENQIPFDRWWTPQWPPQEGVRHTVDLLADHLEGELGARIPEEERVPRLQVFPGAAGWVEHYLRHWRRGERPLVSLVVSAANALKWWVVEGWARLNDGLSRLGCDTLLVAPRSHPHARQVYEACEVKPLWPEVGLRRLAALLARSAVVVGIDTGPLHMAAALGVPWIGLYGASNPSLIGPYEREKGRTLVARFPKPESCSQCWLSFKNRDQGCATLPSTGCVTAISAEEVLEAVNVLLGTGFASLPAPRSRDRR
jgi:ADP-heptose:LPS heptosyltransferase